MAFRSYCVIFKAQELKICSYSATTQKAILRLRTGTPDISNCPQLSSSLETSLLRSTMQLRSLVVV